MLHSSRDPGKCTMTPEQCAYKNQYWVFWYEADHRYALPTVAFFLVAIVLFTVAHLVTLVFPQRFRTNPMWLRALSLVRFLSYKGWRVAKWNTQSLGVILLGAAGLVFFLGESKTRRTCSVMGVEKLRFFQISSIDPWAPSILLAQYHGN